MRESSARVLAANPAFDAEFTALAGARDTTELAAALEAVDTDPDGTTTVFAAATGRWYERHRHVLDPSTGTVALHFANVSDRVDSLRRHREQHEQLLSTSRAMSVGEMATTLAHELNQPLAATVNYLSGCEQLAQQMPDHDALTQALQLARRQAERAAQIIRSIREFVRRREPKREPVAVAGLVAEVSELLRLETVQHRIRIAQAIPAGTPAVMADRVMLEQVLLNLMKNAIEAMRDTPPAQRLITVSARVDDDDMVELRVADHGHGLDENGVANLFTPFFTTKSEGLGIGLAICRSIIEYHQGRLFAEPNAPAEGGCALVFTLPQGQAA